MKIPADAIIALDKLTKYLLVQRPRNDKSKFLAKAGFTQSNPSDLIQAIRITVASHDAIQDRRDEYGIFYLVTGDLHGPDGTLAIVTVWILRATDEQFHFVTLKPARIR